MNKLIIILLLHITIPAIGQQKEIPQQTYSQNEIDLKIQLQEQKIDALCRQVIEQKTYINDRLFEQDKHISIASSNYSNHINLWSSWMSAISIVTAIILAFIGWFISWKFKGIHKEVNTELMNIQHIKNLAEQDEIIAQKTKAEINCLKDEVIELKAQAEKYLSQIQNKSEEVTLLVDKIKEALPLQKNPENKLKEKIVLYVEEIQNTKTEAELTANDWLLKGYDSQLKNQMEDAIYFYKKAIELNPKSAISYNGWGEITYELANLYSNADFYKESINKFKKAISLEVNNPYFYNNLGNALSRLGILISDEKLINEGISNYKKAIELDNKNAFSYNNWGNALTGLAQINSNTNLFKDSIDKFKKAIELDPNNSHFYNSWGHTLLKYTTLTNSLQQNKDKIESILLRGNAIDTTACLYNLSCLYSRLNEKGKALSTLEKELKFNLNDNSRINIESDIDFENLKNDPDFITLLDRYYPNT